MKFGMMMFVFALTGPAAFGGALAEDAKMAEADGVAAAKAALFEALTDYRPGVPATEELTARIDAAAARLEQAAGGPPDLRANLARLSGQWVSLFSSQGVVGEIEVSFMTRALPGGGHAGGKALSQVVLQELRPAERFYRNMMVMTAGDRNIPLLHVATAFTDVAEEAPTSCKCASPHRISAWTGGRDLGATAHCLSIARGNALGGECARGPLQAGRHLRSHLPRQRSAH